MRIELTGNDLTVEQVLEVALGEAEVRLHAEARGRMEASRAVVERVLASGAAVYGVNTGFGKLAEKRIEPDQLRQLQVNLVRSHACGVGAALTDPETRAVMLLRANALAKGFSGVRPVVVETLCAMLISGVHAVIPEKGSVGASGDLAPLAHLALVLIGEGEARYRGEQVSGSEAMKRAGIAPVALEAKEGLSLLNGTQGMLALLCLAIGEAETLADTADVAAALSLDALRGSPTAFDERIAKARPHPGHAEVARNLLRLNAGSQIRESHRSAERDPRVQDAYSLRCAPQVHGAVRDAIRQVKAVTAIELNSATDNPLVFVDRKGGEVLSGGNFHGQPLAMAADQLAVALATLGGISERRTETMTNPLTSLLPAFLTKEAGLNSGFMIAQVTAAALASELKMQATPHSVDSISTSGNQEDYVSMGMGATRRLRAMLENLRNILAIELLAACQGIDLLAPLKTGALAQKAYEAVRNVSAKLEADRALAGDIQAVAFLVGDGAFQRILQ
ncbi:MAG TPA: histidine ammonia-lyase [Candidatus Acidoferrales bacterium]|nr:histidine ammonia-lyase [Candidatus Acidoferrales bacterium]